MCIATTASRSKNSSKHQDAWLLACALGARASPPYEEHLRCPCHLGYPVGTADLSFAENTHKGEYRDARKLFAESVYIPHGAGPCFFMGWNPPGTWEKMAAWLRELVDHVGVTPKALLVVSAHWEAEVFTANTQAQPGLLYDYAGFPEHTYHFTWPAPGTPALATKVGALPPLFLGIPITSRNNPNHGKLFKN